MRSRLTRTVLVAALLVGALILGACAQESPESEPESAEEPAGDAAAGDAEADASEAFPVTVTDGRDAEVEIEQEPQRVVSLSPTHTEILFAVGAGDQVVAVDEWSTHPEQAPTTDLSAFEPDVEAILEHDPDLIVLADAPALAEELSAVEVDVLAFTAPTDLDGAYDQWRTTGEATGHADDAEELVDEVSGDIDALVSQTPSPDEPLSFFHEIDENLYSAGSQTFIGQLYAQLGLENIADTADEPYPQLSPEAVVDADPDIVFVASGTPLEEVAERPGWSSVTAVAEDNLYAVDGDLGSRWGPRVDEFLGDVAEAVTDTVERRG